MRHSSIPTPEHRLLLNVPEADRFQWPPLPILSRQHLVKQCCSNIGMKLFTALHLPAVGDCQVHSSESPMALQNTDRAALQRSVQHTERLTSPVQPVSVPPRQVALPLHRRIITSFRICRLLEVICFVPGDTCRRSQPALPASSCRHPNRSAHPPCATCGAHLAAPPWEAGPAGLPGAATSPPRTLQLRQYQLQRARSRWRPQDRLQRSQRQVQL